MAHIVADAYDAQKGQKDRLTFLFAPTDFHNEGDLQEVLRRAEDLLRDNWDLKHGGGPPGNGHPGGGPPGGGPPNASADLPF